MELSLKAAIVESKNNSSNNTGKLHDGRKYLFLASMLIFSLIESSITMENNRRITEAINISKLYVYQLRYEFRYNITIFRNQEKALTILKHWLWRLTSFPTIFKKLATKY